MRFALALAVVLLPLVCSAAADGRATGFVNHTVSARSIALNEPVRVEFITMGRQVDGVDPAMAVRSALGYAARLVTRGEIWETCAGACLVLGLCLVGAALPHVH